MKTIFLSNLFYQLGLRKQWFQEKKTAKKITLSLNNWKLLSQIPQRNYLFQDGPLAQIYLTR